LMIANWVYWRRVSGASKRIFATIKSTIDAVRYYIIMEITVLYLKISRHQLSI
jgi:hypothetical protein